MNVISPKYISLFIKYKSILANSKIEPHFSPQTYNIEDIIKEKDIIF